MESNPCPLCSGASFSFYIQKQREFLQCSYCLSVFNAPMHYLTPQQEKAHYECHNNNPEDTEYQNFVSPVINAVLRDFSPEHSGLDFGSGTGSPVVKVLHNNNYNIDQYDIYFHNNSELFKKQYNYITCTEVIEHFKQPYKEFKLLRSLLLPGGKLYLMTEIFEEAKDFSSWYYKNDPTHIFLYHPKVFEWISKEFGFRKVTIDKRFITLEL